MQDGKTAEVGAEEASWKERILRDPAGGRGLVFSLGQFLAGE